MLSFPVSLCGRNRTHCATCSGLCTHFSLAISQRWKVSGESKEYTEWVNIEAWGRLGEVCQEYLKKGSLIYLEGRLQTDRYEHEGETRYFTKVIARQVQMLDRKTEEEPALEVIEEDPVPE